MRSLIEGQRCVLLAAISIALCIANTGCGAAVSNVGSTTTAPETSAPLLSFSPTAVDFGSLALGGRASRSVVIANTGGGALTITSITSTGDFVQSNDCGATVQANSSCTVTVTFSPTVLGSRAGALSLVDNASGSPQRVALTGTGVAASALSFTPTSISFGILQVGDSSSRQVQVTNPGTSAISVVSASASGPGFSINGLTFPVTVAAGQSIAFNVVFAPTTSGAATGSVAIIDNTTGTPTTISLSGTANAVATAKLTFTPTSINFGSIPVGNTSSQPLKISNPGTSSVSIVSASTSGSAFSISGLTLPRTISAGQTITVNAVFAPMSTGTATGSMLIGDSTGTATTIALTGTGTAVASTRLTLTPTSIGFGNVLVGNTSSQPAQLSNPGTASVSIVSASTSGPGFGISGLTPPLIMTAGQTLTFSVKFSPSNGGTSTGTVAITDDSGGAPYVITLAGTGVTPIAHSVILSWNASASAVVGYNLYRSTQSNGAFTRLNSTLEPGTSYTDFSVSSGQSYWYAVTAVDADALESVFSNTVNVVIPTP